MLLFAWLCLSYGAIDADLVVTTTTGKVQGFMKTDTCVAFLGIPYAQPPIGDLRFSPTKPVLPWNNVLNASSFSPVCVQIGSGGSEDCLYLNVYVHAKESTALLPVMFWIHGGGFQMGTGSDYDGSVLASRREVIIVTINYRLTIFGYFQSELIKKENPDEPTLGGMNGVLDQWEALKWIKANAQNFGGDPNRITIFGESAGSLSVGYLLTSPKIPIGLYQNAIMESGSIAGPWGPFSSEFGLYESDGFMKLVGATTLAELRKLNVSEFTNNLAPFYFAPVLDDYFYPEFPIHYFSQGGIRIPKSGSIIIGANTLDTLFAWPWYSGSLPETPSELRTLLIKYFGTETTEELLKMYYPSPNPPRVPKLTFQVMNRDVCVVCPTRFIADTLAFNPSTSFNTYLYLFGFHPSPNDKVYANYASHGAELPLVFGAPFFVFDFNQTLAESMGDYWTSFAATGNPNSNNAPDATPWPRWETRQHIYFNELIQVYPGWHDVECAFWEKYANGGEQNVINLLNFCIQQQIAH